MYLCVTDYFDAGITCAHFLLVNNTAFSADSDRVSFLASRNAITLLKQCGDDATLLGTFFALIG